MTLYTTEIAIYYAENNPQAAYDLAEAIENQGIVDWDGSEGGLGSYDLVDGTLLENTTPKDYVKAVRLLAQERGFTVSIETEPNSLHRPPGTVLLWLSETRPISADELE